MSDGIQQNSLNENDLILSYDDVISYRIAPGNLYWVRKNGSKVLLRKAGDPIDTQYFSKFEKIKCEFALTEGTRINFLNDSAQTLMNLSVVEFEHEKWELRDKYIKWFERNYLNENSTASLLELILIGTKTFLRISPELEALLVDYSVTNYRRSALAGILAVSYALCLGYLDYKLLQDLYHSFFIQDIYFAKNGTHYVFTKATEAERIDEGGLIKTLAHFSMTSQLISYYDHVEKGIELIDEYAAFFNYEEWKKMMALHHEKLTGGGFPGKKNADELGDFELIYLFVNSKISYEDFDFGEQDGYEKVSKYLNEQMNNNYELRLMNNIKSAINHMKEDDVA